jgi:hypothetical protein
MTDSAARWTFETLRLYHRYDEEVVGALGLCPWAGPARRDGRVVERVFLQEGDALSPSLDAIDSLDPRIDVALFLYPRMAAPTGGSRGADRDSFEQFGKRLRDAEVARRPLGGAPFVFAVFHPDAVPLLDEPERLIPFLRRTPHPTLQLVRSSILDHVRGVASQGTHFVDLRSMFATSAPVVPLRERIAATNLETVLRVGLDTIVASIEDIQRDRDETHAKLTAGRTRSAVAIDR